MASRKLKVFRTAIGFHDAYVAAPSQKAALAAWGSDRKLFAIGGTEPVEDGPLAEKALATPGKVNKVARGTADQHFAALPKARKKTTEAAPREKIRKTPASKKAPTPKRPPRPGRTAVKRAEKNVREAEKARITDLVRSKQKSKAGYSFAAPRLARLLPARATTWLGTISCGALYSPFVFFEFFALPSKPIGLEDHCWSPKRYKPSLVHHAGKA